jgi:energy-coupling factor transporter transmembrane protein EcfT
MNQVESPFEPSCRLACLALLSSASLIASWPCAALIAAGATIFLLRRGMMMISILRESAFVLVFASITGLLRMVGSAERGDRDLDRLAVETGVYAIRLAAAFLAGRLFYASTRLSEMRDAGTRIARRLPFLRRIDLGLLFSLILGFIPLIFEEWRSSREAAASRGMAKRADLSALASFVATFLRRLMLRSVALPEALAARGWTNERGLSPFSWKLRDSLAVVACSALLVVALLRIV